MKERAKSSGTLTNREASWNGGYHMTVANPFLGVGLGDYGKYTRKYATVYVSATAPHNIYVKLVAESGIFVFLVFLFFVFILLFQNFKKIFNTNYFWIYMSFLSLLLMGMTIGITYDKYFLLYIAIMLNTNYLINQKEIL
jgi:O-antigen ligase